MRANLNICKVCLVEKEWEEFPKNKHYKSGYKNNL